MATIDRLLDAPTDAVASVLADARADELPRRLLLTVGMGPVGVAEVEFGLASEGGGTRVTMREDPVSGPIKAVWSPPLAAAMRVRNDRALRRLEKIAGERARIRSLDAQ